MAIYTLNEKFVHELRDLYDAEHQFLEAQQMMVQQATDASLKTNLITHIQQTQQHITNLEQAFKLLGQQAKRQPCDAAKGLVSEGQKSMKEAATVPTILDCVINGAAGKVEHYEIAGYRGLIAGAELMGQEQVVALLRENLRQEEQTAQLVEQSEPTLLRKAMQQEGQATPSMGAAART